MRHHAPEQLPVLTSLRGIAALFIALYHFRYPNTLDIDFRPYSYLLANGYLMVDLFFVLSGFILMHAYRSVFSSIVKPSDWAAFLWVRFARVYPLHIFTLAALVLFLLIRESTLGMPPYAHFSGAAFLHNVFLTHGPWLSGPTWNTPAWSISWEAHAYLIFPWLCLAAHRQSLRGVLLCCALALVPLFMIGKLNISGGPYVFFRVFPEFTAGILLYRLHEANAANWLFRRDASLVICAGGALFAMHINANDGFAVLCFCGLILAGAAGRGRAAGILARQPFKRLGDISYSIYLCHMPLRYVALTVLTYWGWPDEGRTIPQALGLFFVLVPTLLLSATLTYRYVEVPARRWLRGLQPSRRSSGGFGAGIAKQLVLSGRDPSASFGCGRDRNV